MQPRSGYMITFLSSSRLCHFPESRRFCAALTTLAALASVPAAQSQDASSAGRAGSYAPGSRSTASMNGTFQSVVGQIPSPTQTRLGKDGKTFRVDESGQISGPDRRHIAPGCVRTFSPTPARATALPGRSQLIQAAQGRQPPTGDALQIGKIPTPDTAIFTGPLVVINASDGPSGLYVVPAHCDDGQPVRTLTTAASAVASTGGNPFALAGNRADLRDGLHASPLPSGDIALTP